MRIVGGEFKGRTLKAPSGRKVRPTSDRIRESIFDLLGPEIRGRKVLDLFAGTGALGIEAISRGYQTAVFVERDRTALRLIRDNLALCELSGRCRVEERDVFDFFKRFDASAPFDLVLIDPPYGQGLVEKALEELVCVNGIAVDGRVVCEGERELKLPKEIGDLELVKRKQYGDTSVHVYRCQPGCIDKKPERTSRFRRG